MRVKAGKLARHAARQIERLAAVPPDRGNSFELQRSHAPLEPCNLPLRVFTQNVKASIRRNLFEIIGLHTAKSGQLRFLGWWVQHGSLLGFRGVFILSR